MATTVTPNGSTHEIPVEDMFFSTTDRRGVIEQANEVFSRLARHPMADLVGQPHNIIRHPDMPGGAFRAVWGQLEQGQATCAYVKNLAGDGSTYWAFATIVPTADGYLSVRCRPMRTDLMAAADGIYRVVRPAELAAREQGSSAAAAAQTGEALVLDHLGTAGFADYRAFSHAALAAEAEARLEHTRGIPKRRLVPGAAGAVLAEATSIEGEVRLLTRSLVTSQTSAAELTDRIEQARAAMAGLSEHLETIRDIVVPQADRAPLVAGAVPGVQDKCLGVAAALARVAERVSAVQASRAALRFSAALAQLQAEMVGRFALARVDGQETEESFDSAVAALVECLGRGLTALADDATLDEHATAELRAELEQAGPSLRITRMMVRRFVEIVRSTPSWAEVASLMPELEQGLETLTSTLRSVAHATTAFADSTVRFDTGDVDEMLGRVRVRLAQPV